MCVDLVWLQKPKTRKTSMYVSRGNVVAMLLGGIHRQSSNMADSMVGRVACTLVWLCITLQQFGFGEISVVLRECTSSKPKLKARLPRSAPLLRKI